MPSRLPRRATSPRSAAAAKTLWGAAPLLVAWVLAPALGLSLRLAPPAGSTWTLDAAGHRRLIAERIEQGRLPDPDALADLPQGRRLGRYLPLGLYELTARWHGSAGRIAGWTLDESLTRFTALAGALIAWPVWLGALALGAGPWGAALAALVAAIVPAHVEQTTAWLLRYDALGTLLVTTHLALGLAALRARSPRDQVARSALSGLALIAALSVWRVPLIFPALAAAGAALIAVLRPPTAALASWIAATALALVMACLGLEYLRAQHHLLAASTLGVVAVAAALQAPPLRRPDSRPYVRAAILLGAIVIAVGIAALLRRGGDYQTLGQLLRLRALMTFGIIAGADPMTGVLLTVRELEPLPPAALAGPALFSWLGPWLLLAPLVMWVVSRKRLRAWLGADEATRLTVGMTAALTILTLLANRNRILLAPLVAVLTGTAAGSLARVASSATRGGATPTGGAAPAARRGTGDPEPGGARVQGPRWLAVAAMIALLPCVLACFYFSLRSARRLTTQVTPAWAAVRDYVREHASGQRVFSFWERGYELQAAGCATYADGLLESAVNQRHILAGARALMMQAPDSLAAICERLAIGYLVIPPSWSLYGVAMAAQDSMVETLVLHEPLSPDQADRVVIRMMLRGGEEPPFEPVFERGGYHVYRRVPAAPRGAIGARPEGRAESSRP